MRLLDATYLTEDEGYDVEGDVARKVKNALKALNLDSYNAQYVVRLTVDREDEPPPDPDDD